jgi:hypothetical protein
MPLIQNDLNKQSAILAATHGKKRNQNETLNTKKIKTGEVNCFEYFGYCVTYENEKDIAEKLQTLTDEREQ